MSPRLQEHFHSVLRAQRNERVGFNLKAEGDTKAEMTIEQHRHDHQFLQGEMIAYATARSCTKRKICHAVRSRTLIRRESRRIEFPGLGPIFWAPVEMENRHD